MNLSTTTMYTPRRKPTRSSTVCTEATTASKRKRRRNVVNKLPPEVLSDIMQLAVESDRKSWTWGSTRVGSQQVASHVCRYWREVAVGTPALWSFLHIRTAPLTKRISLNISRAGPSTPLEIAIDIPNHRGGPTPEKDWELFTQVLNAIIGHGAHTNRWHSLLINSSADNSKIIAIFANFTSQHPVPSLERLHIDSSKGGRSSENNHVSFGLALSNIRILKLVSPPSQLGFLMSPELTRLTTVTIVSAEVDSTQVANLLGSHPQLESLWLDDGDRQSDSDHINIAHMNRANALYLRSLSIRARRNPSWALRMLIALKAPELTHFGLQCDSSPALTNLMAYIMTGVRSTNSTKSDSGGDPIYPSLQSLDIHRFSCPQDKFKHFVSSFPNLTRLSACAEQVGWFQTMPWILPRLESIRVPELPVNHDAVMELLSRRIDLNLRIKEVAGQRDYLRLAGSQHVPISLEGYRPAVALAYELYQDEDAISEKDLASRPLVLPRVR